MQKLFLLIILISFTPVLNSQSYSEGPDLSNISPGQTFTFSGPSITISGQMNTPADGSEYFVIQLPVGCQINSVDYQIGDPNPVGISGYFQFGTNNQESYTGATISSFANATQFPTSPFPMVGPANLQCQAQANIAWISNWSMTFTGTCGTTCTDPTVPSLSASAPSICPGTSSDISISGALNDATAWEVYTDSCGGQNIGNTAGSLFTVSPSATTTYYFRGEGGCVIPGNCGNITITVNPDNVAPSVSCPGTQVLTINGNCQFVLPDYKNQLTITDNCDPNPIILQEPAPGSIIQANTSIHVTVTDASGNSSDCSFNVTINDTIGPINTDVTQNGNILTADNANASYQWVDCTDGFTAIPGDTMQTCSICQTISGDYAVIIKEKSCVDTSNCHQVTVVGIDNTNSPSPFRFYPNPVNGLLFIDFGNVQGEKQLTITDISGKRVYSGIINETGSYPVRMKYPSGIYLAYIMAKGEVSVFKFLLE